MSDRYEGPIEPGQVFTCPDNDGRLGFRRVRVVGPNPFDSDGLILEELESRCSGHRVGEIFRCPELNLRIVFQPEEPS